MKDFAEFTGDRKHNLEATPATGAKGFRTGRMCKRFIKEFLRVW